MVINMNTTIKLKMNIVSLPPNALDHQSSSPTAEKNISLIYCHHPPKN